MSDNLQPRPWGCVIWGCTQMIGDPQELVYCAFHRRLAQQGVQVIDLPKHHPKEEARD